MKKSLLLAGLLLVLVAPMAMAGGANITWGNGCWSDIHTNLQTFACNNNATTVVYRLTCSAQVDADIPDFLAVDIQLVGKSAVATMPDWWMLDSGQCRNSATNPTFTSDFTAITPTACTDLFFGAGGGGGGYLDYLTPASGLDPNIALFKMSWAVPDPMDMPPDVEFLIGQFKFTNFKTLGATACAGCGDAVTWGFHDVRVSSNSGFQMLQDPIPTSFNGGNNCAFWQAMTVPCAAPVPAKNTTWGQVKSLYR